MGRAAWLLGMALLALGCTEKTPGYCDRGTPCGPGMSCDTTAHRCVPVQAGGADLSGAASRGWQFFPLPAPVRLLSTQPTGGGCSAPGVPLMANVPFTQPVRTVSCQGMTIPAEATAVVGNATAADLTGKTGQVFLYAAGAEPPLIANLNYGLGQNFSNAVTVGLGADGSIAILATTSPEFVLDIIGYYAPPAAGGLYYHPLPAPFRLLDTRPGSLAYAVTGVPQASMTKLVQQARGLAYQGITVPNDAAAITASITVIIDGSTGGFANVFPSDVTQSPTYTIQWGTNLITNFFTTRLDGRGTFTIYTADDNKPVDLIVDMAGYYSETAMDENGPGLLYNSLSSPIRVSDADTPLQNQMVRSIIARGAALGGVTIPLAARAVFGNATESAGPGSPVSIYPGGIAKPPLITNLTYSGGPPLSAAFAVGLGSSGDFNVLGETGGGQAHFTADLFGYFE